jgi:HK97 family phage prohead protease
MSEKQTVVKKYFQTEVTKSEDGRIKIILSKQVEDRDGEVLMIDGCDIENFRKNSIVLWGHRMIGGDIEDVIGTLVNIEKTVDQNTVPMMTGYVEFADHPKAQYLKGMVEKGIITSVSVGFGIKDGGYNADTRTINQWELYEVSFVTVPANPEARVTKGMKKAIQIEKDPYKMLLNYERIHPVVKTFRKLFLSDELCEKIGYNKTGNELEDIQNVFSLMESKSISSDQETPEADDKKEETPQYVTQKDLEEIKQMFIERFGTKKV